LRRSRKADGPRRSLPASLLTHRISELHRKLIDPASDIKTVKAAKHSLLRLLSDPLTLPVITTPPMVMPLPPEADAGGKPAEAKQVCEICERPLSRISATQPRKTGRRARKSSIPGTQLGSLRSHQQKPVRRSSLSQRTPPALALSRSYSLS
jgi:hypothetical protein